MNVIIQVNGREAIPVRAIPWLTHDRLFTAQDVADALSLSAKFPDFSGIHPLRLEGGIVTVDSWRNEVSTRVKSLEAQELKDEQWRLDSLATLPAGTFVWRDEWESAYNQSPYGPDALKLLGDAADSDDIDERTLNFAPHIPHDLVRLVMEGFTQREAQTPAPAQTATPAPVVVDCEWKKLAQAKAREYIKQQRERDYYPSQEAVGDWIATDFRKSGIVGSDGKPITGSTIKRHALKGISSATGKQLSTAIGRGK